MNSSQQQLPKQSTTSHKFWCHFCQTNFYSNLKPGKDVILCTSCNNDYCELVTKNEEPQKFLPFQKQPMKNQKYTRKINPQLRKMTINELMQILQVKQSQNFDLTQQMVQKLRKKTQHNSECSVCRQQIIAKEEALIPKCGHTFHQECVREWIQRKNTCPSCRGQIVQTLDLKSS